MPSREAQGARWSSQPSKLPFEPFAGLEGGFDSHTLPPRKMNCPWIVMGAFEVKHE